MDVLLRLTQYIPSITYLIRILHYLASHFEFGTQKAYYIAKYAKLRLFILD